MNLTYTITITDAEEGVDSSDVAEILATVGDKIKRDAFEGMFMYGHRAVHWFKVTKEQVGGGSE